MTEFWVAPYSYVVFGVARRHDKRERHRACPGCWAVIEAGDPIDLATRSVVADLAQGRQQHSFGIEGYTAAYLELLAAREGV